MSLANTSSPSSSSSDLLPFTCNTTFDAWFEIAKYVGSLIYLVPGVSLHFLVLRCILVKHRRHFVDSSFFRIFVADSIASVYIILWDIGFSRLFLYVPPLCPIVGPFFWSPSLFLKFYYYTTNHARFAKSVAQSFLVLNRMSCVLVPLSYDAVWKRFTRVTVLLVAVLPLAGTWNLLLSRTKVFASYGGFGVSYNRYVEWAALSLFQLIFIVVALIFTVICTSVTLFKLISIPERIKSAEKSLCVTSILISLTFLLVAVTQVYFAFCSNCYSIRFWFIAQFLAFDLYTVGSAVIIVLTNVQLRQMIFSKRFSKITDNRIFQRSQSNS